VTAAEAHEGRRFEVEVEFRIEVWLPINDDPGRVEPRHPVSIEQETEVNVAGFSRDGQFDFVPCPIDRARRSAHLTISAGGLAVSKDANCGEAVVQ